MDEALKRRGWKRAVPDDLSESSRLAARLVTRSMHVGEWPPYAVIDVHLWLNGQNVRVELAEPVVTPFVEVLVVQGVLGVPPHTLGLTPCMHEPWHWNPFFLPLVWQQDMNDFPRFTAFVRRYSQLLEDPTWQCPDAARLLQ